MSFSSEKLKKTPISISSPPTQKKIGSYLIRETIGKGTFSKVCIGVHLYTKEKVAIKILQKNKIKDRIDIERINREISILKTTNHPNISQLYETLSTSNNYYIIMEFISGGDLFNYIQIKKKLTETQSCYFFRQIIASVDYLHKQEIIHRDIKPENMLLDEDNKMLKVIDFGLSNICSKHEVLKSSCGSPCYASPEMISGKAYRGSSVDIWSCGVVLYCMLFGILPFDEDDLLVLYNKIKLGVYILPKTISEPARDLISRMLKVNPKQRISIEDIIKHPWFNIETNMLYKGIYYYYDSIQVDSSIVAEIKQTYFKEDSSVTEDLIYQSVQEYKYNKYSAIYYLYIKAQGYQVNSCMMEEEMSKINNNSIKTRNNIQLRKTNNYNVFVINNIFPSSQDKSPNKSTDASKTLKKNGITFPTQPSNLHQYNTNNKDNKTKSSLSSLSVSLSRSLNKSTQIKKNKNNLDSSVDTESRIKNNQRRLIVKYIKNKINIMPNRDMSKNDSLNSKYAYQTPKNISIELVSSCNKRNKSENCAEKDTRHHNINQITQKKQNQSKQNNIRPIKPQFPSSMSSSQDTKMRKEPIITLILQKYKDKQCSKESIPSNTTQTNNSTNNNIKVLHQNRQLSPFAKSIMQWKSNSKSKSKSKPKNSNNRYYRSPPKNIFQYLTTNPTNKDQIKEALLKKLFLPKQ